MWSGDTALEQTLLQLYLKKTNSIKDTLPLSFHLLPKQTYMLARKSGFKVGRI